MRFWEMIGVVVTLSVGITLLIAGWEHRQARRKELEEKMHRFSFYASTEDFKRKKTLR